MTSINNLNATEVLDKIQAKLCIKYRIDLGKHLGVSQSKLSRQEKVGELPLKEIIRFALTNGWSLDELFGNTLENAKDGSLNAQRIIYFTELVMGLIESYVGQNEIEVKMSRDNKRSKQRIEMAKALMELAMSTNGNEAALDLFCRGIIKAQTNRE